MNKRHLTGKDVLGKIQKEKEQLKKIGVKKIGLFGSFVKGKQKKESDIDFLVEFQKDTFDNYMNLLILLENLLKRRIDLVIEKNLKPELNYVKKEAEYVKV
ncbi:nucleotidyltransferase domain-containing protein [Candidatus Pacearchaeota archaeon]|nr:nucleotidyltransferase domain-containing protein [Candidatus Pacearchaeota archaeon]